MVKDYFLLLLDWLRATLRLCDKKSVPTFKEGEIWWCVVGMNIGSEIFGKGRDFSRPVIVFKKIGKDSFLGVPLTTQLKDGSWYMPVFYGNIERRAILSRVRVFDGRRLMELMGTLSNRSFVNLKKRFAAFYTT